MCEVWWFESGVGVRTVSSGLVIKGRVVYLG